MTTDATSTAEIWERLSARLRRFFLARVSDEQAVDDLLQDTFLRIHSKIDTIKNDQRVASWVFQIARNLVTDYYRAKSRQSTGVETDVEADAGEVENLNAQVIGWLPEIINQLPETYREAVRLYELEGIPQQEIADRLGVSLSGVKSKVQRGRQKLKSALLDCCTFQQDCHGNVIDYRKNLRDDSCACDGQK